MSKPTPIKEWKDLTEAQRAAFREHVYQREKETPEYMPIYAMELSLLTGLKVGEIAALKWDCIEHDSLGIRLVKQRDDLDHCRNLVVSRNRIYRKLPMTDDMRELFRKINTLGRTNKDGFIFVDENGERYKESVVGNAIRRVGENIGIEHMSLRRYWANGTTQLERRI